MALTALPLEAADQKTVRSVFYDLLLPAQQHLTNLWLAHSLHFFIFSLPYGQQQ